MIVRDRPSALALFLVMRGAVMPNISKSLLGTTVLEMGADLGRCLSAMTGVAASCERIHGTPIPFSYTLLPHRTAHLYCVLPPFGQVDAIGDLPPLVTALVACTFFGLDAPGDEIEEPFGTSDHDLPLDAICRTIDIDLRTALGDTNLPPPLLPADYRLS